LNADYSHINLKGTKIQEFKKRI